MLAKQRELLQSLGFEGMKGPSPDDLIAALASQGFDVDILTFEDQPATFIEQKGLHGPYSDGHGVSATTTDYWIWSREADLTDSERNQLLECGFLNHTDFAESLGQIRH